MERAEQMRPGPRESTTIIVYRGDTPLAKATLPMPAHPCGGLVAEVSEDTPPDLLILWASQGSEGQTYGVSVFRLP